MKGSHFLDLTAQLLDNADLVDIKSFWLHFKVQTKANFEIIRKGEKHVNPFLFD